jgi:hypothetical protein
VEEDSSGRPVARPPVSDCAAPGDKVSAVPPANGTRGEGDKDGRAGAASCAREGRSEQPSR